MSKPLPILLTPTPESRRAFLVAMQRAGILWCGKQISDYHVDVGARRGYPYAMLRSNLTEILYRSHPFPHTDYVGHGYTLVNSPRHFLQYRQSLL